MMSGWYLKGADGRHFCWAKEPTFICPWGALKAPKEGEPWEVPEPFTIAARALGMDPELLVRLVRRGHHNNRRRRDANGKLTDFCENCGHRMKRLGFRCTVERPRQPSQTEARLGQLGFGTPTEILKTFYVKTKREAEEWARDEVAVTKRRLTKGSDR